MSTNLRTHLRVNLPPGYAVTFEAEGRTFHRAPLINLGCGGCCVELEPGRAAGLHRGQPLQALVLLHPTLPDRPQEGRIIWRMGRQAQVPGEKPSRILLGITFVRPAPEFQFRLLAFVDERLGIQGVA